MRHPSKSLSVPSRRPLPVLNSSAGGGNSSAGGGGSDAGAAFVQRFRSLADAKALEVDITSAGGCCGGKAASEQSVPAQVGGMSQS